MNENNLEESDSESSSMDNDKYRIHMDGDNIYVIYASPSQSSEINQSSYFDSSEINQSSYFDSSKIEIDTSPIIPVISQLQSEHQKSSSYLPQIEYPPYSSILASFPNIQNLPKPSATSSHFLLSSFKTVVQPDSIKTYRAGSEDDSGNYLLNHEKSQFCNAYIHDKVLWFVLHANIISILEFSGEI